jgi:hypothetical protein
METNQISGTFFDDLAFHIMYVGSTPRWLNEMARVVAEEQPDLTCGIDFVSYCLGLFSPTNFGLMQLGVSQFLVLNWAKISCLSMMTKNPQLKNIISTSYWVVVLMLFFTSISVHAQTNLLTNGGFESGTSGWNVWGATLSLSSDAHSGSSAALVSNRNNPWDAIVVDVKDKLVNGQEYILGAWIKLTGPAVNLRATLGIRVDGVNTYISFIWTSSPVSGSYVYYTDSKTISWTGNLESANLYFENESVGGIYSDYLIDDVSFV